MTSPSNKQRDATVKALDASIARLDRQGRALKTQLAGMADRLQRKTLTGELAKADAMIAERRKQRLATLTPAATVALKQAMDMDKALQTAINDLQRDFTIRFQRYNAFLNTHCLGFVHA